MKTKPRRIHLDSIPHKYKGKTYYSHLLRTSNREGKDVSHETLSNVSCLPSETLYVLKQSLAGKHMMAIEDILITERTTPTGHVRAVLGTMKNLGIAELVASRPSRERDLVMGMIAQRILDPKSKLASIRLWHTSTLAADLEIEDARVEEIYPALEWLWKRKERIEGKLARRHLSHGELALYDMSNSKYEGEHCPLAKRGRDKAGRHGVLLISYSVLTDADGRPIGLEVYPGNTGDSSTVFEQALKLRDRFGLEDMILVGDRGMLTDGKIDVLKKYPGVGWITALRSEPIRNLLDGEILQLSLFDERNLAEIQSPDFPGERLVACFNPLLAEERSRKRDELLRSTEKNFEKIRKEAQRRTKKPLSDAELGSKVGVARAQYKVGKHFIVTIGNGKFEYSRNEESIRREREMDGIYVLRTNQPRERIASAEVVRDYKRLAEVERAFRCMKGPDLQAAPIFLRLEDRVKAHYLLCFLAYYVEWHMRKLLAPLLYQDESLPEERSRRDPVAKAEPTEWAKLKKSSKRTSDGFIVHDFHTLLKELSMQSKVRYRVMGAPEEAVFDQIGAPTPIQKKAFDLLGL